MKTVSIESGAVVVRQATTSKDSQGDDMPTGTTWVFYGDQADKHRAQFPEIDADQAASEKAAELAADAVKARR